MQIHNNHIQIQWNAEKKKKNLQHNKTKIKAMQINIQSEALQTATSWDGFKPYAIEGRLGHDQRD